MFRYILFKHSEGFAKIFVHYLFFGQVPYGNLLVPGQVSAFAISTP